MTKRKAKQVDMFSDRADDTPLFSRSPMRADSSEFAPKQAPKQARLFVDTFDELAEGARAKRKERAEYRRAQIELDGDDTAGLPLFNGGRVLCSWCSKYVHSWIERDNMYLCDDCQGE